MGGAGGNWNRSVLDERGSALGDCSLTDSYADDRLTGEPLRVVD